jgi:hypothetical protein
MPPLFPSNANIHNHPLAECPMGHRETLWEDVGCRTGGVDGGLGLEDGHPTRRQGSVNIWNAALRCDLGGFCLELLPENNLSIK